MTLAEAYVELRSDLRRSFLSRRLPPAEVPDLVQATWVVVLEVLGRRRTENLRKTVFGVAFRLALMWRRDAARAVAPVAALQHISKCEVCGGPVRRQTGRFCAALPCRAAYARAYRTARRQQEARAAA